MVLKVILYDEYYDIPLRGLLQTESSVMAFFAHTLDDEPEEIAGRRGVYSRIRGFECDEVLRTVLEEKKGIFRKWRAAFDKGDVDTATHPLCVDPIYQQLSLRSDGLFRSLGTPIMDATGLMRVVSGQWVFEPVRETPPGRDLKGD
jgi:hypothetical protein